jgi:hypothetical protein
MDQETYNMRVKAFLAAMRERNANPESVAAVLDGIAQADKSATEWGVAYKAAPGMVALALPAAVVDQLGGPDAVKELVRRAAQTPARGVRLHDDQSAGVLKSIAAKTAPDLYRK